MVDAEYDPEEIGEPIPRTPSMEDLVGLCKILNESDAKYLVIGGFAIISCGYLRVTQDVDFVIATDLDNEAKVYAALATLPDQAVLELKPGEVSEYTVVRINDEITVDLMASASVYWRASDSPDRQREELAGIWQALQDLRNFLTDSASEGHGFLIEIY